MPTFASAPLQNFVGTRVRQSLQKPDSNENPGEPPGRKGTARHLYISPALYVTPEQAPIPESPSPGLASPSPYVANQKRRRVRTERGRAGEAETADLPPRNDVDKLNLEEGVGDNFGNGNLNENQDNDEGDDDEEEGFLSPMGEAVSVGSEIEANDLAIGSQMESRGLVSVHGDYYDANDDFSSDSSNSNIPSQSSRVESDLHSIKLSIVDEIERRKAVEETLMLLQSQWERIYDLMSKVGLMFPAPPAGDKMQLEEDSLDQFSQEVFVSRFVAEAIGRGQARAEGEEAAAMIIELKDQELLRLRDRLQYYETVNHELSQRKLVEVAQRQKLRIRRRRWLWGFLGLSIAIGASFVAYSCIPRTDRILSSPESSDPADAACLSSSSTL